MKSFTERHKEALTEVVNIGIGRAACILSSMSRAPVSLQVPDLQILCLTDVARIIADRWEEKLVSVSMSFCGAFEGSTDLVFPSDSAAALVKALIGDVGPDLDLDTLRLATLTEVGNVVINGVMGSIGNVLDEHLRYGIPDTREEDAEHLFDRHRCTAEESDDYAILARTGFIVDELHLAGEIVIIFDVGSVGSLIHALDAILPAA